MQSQQSDIVTSITGRDCGSMLVVVAAEGDSVLVANGKNRRAENPKRKKRKHIRFVAHSDARTQERLTQNGRLTNSELRKAISLWAESDNS